MYGMTGNSRPSSTIWLPLMPHRLIRKCFAKWLAVSTAAGSGQKVTKISGSTFTGESQKFGYAKNIRATNWEMVPAKRKARIEIEVIRLAAKIRKRMGNVKPGIKTKVIFKVMALMQKSNEWNPADREHWKQNGWLSGKRP